MGYKKCKKYLMVYLPLIVIAFFTAAPILWSIITSFKMPEDVFKLPVKYIPDPATFSNYIVSWTRNKFSQYFMNSLVIGLGSVVFIVILSLLNGYALSRFRFKGKGVFLILLLLTQIMPVVIYIVPLFLMFNRMGLINTRGSVILFYIVSQTPFNTLLMRGFINDVPVEIEEAAMIDGCGRFRIFFSVIAPLLTPIASTIVILQAVTVFNDFVNPLYFLPGNENVTIQLTVYNFMGKFSNKYNLLFADIVIVTIPMLLLFIFFNKKIIDGMAAGAVKG